MKNVYQLIAFLFSIAGTLFSGYYSYVKMTTEGCPFNESCPIFLGYPACYTGFIIFCACLLLSTTIYILGQFYLTNALITISLIGVIFSGFYAYQDIFYPNCPLGECNYTLLLPTCVYGFIFFIVVFMATVFDYGKYTKYRMHQK